MGKLLRFDKGRGVFAAPSLTDEIVQCALTHPHLTSVVDNVGQMGEVLRFEAALHDFLSFDPANEVHRRLVAQFQRRWLEDEEFQKDAWEIVVYVPCCNGHIQRVQWTKKVAPQA